MKRRDTFFAILLFLSVVLGGVSVWITMAFLEDVKLGCPVWAGILVYPCICAIFMGSLVAIPTLAFYAKERRSRDLLPLCISGASSLLLCAVLFLWFIYPFPNKFPMP